MKVIAFNGSPRPDGNTALLLQHVLEPIKARGIATEVVQLGGSNIHGCRACYACMQKKDGHCTFNDDVANEFIAKMVEADGIILGSPTYFADVTTEIKALIDRAGFVTRANGDLLKRKVGAAVIAVRRAGELHAFDSINHFFLISQMIVPGSCYWNVGIGRDKGDVGRDEEGLKTMRVLGENMAWLMESVAGRK
ncbi:MAG: flavodoxin family protein [Phycisphaerae bacterium]